MLDRYYTETSFRRAHIYCFTINDLMFAIESAVDIVYGLQR